MSIAAKRGSGDAWEGYPEAVAFRFDDATVSRRG